MENLAEIYNNGKGKAVYFVIANPPDNRDSLLSLVSKHFKAFAPNDTIEKYYHYHHFYFKETRFTPRDYKEEWKGYFNHDYIDNHYEDLLIDIYIYSKSKIFTFYKNGKINEEIEQKWKEEQE
ncbi:MAG: hypothetical protein LBJ63_08390 [Prevotellaceae bacterium]|nr:hypothetical protein [Prevotellaceae bacterium]